MTLMNTDPSGAIEYKIIRSATGAFKDPAKFRAALVLLSTATLALAADPDRDSPEAELVSFKMAPGFEIHLWASERDGVSKPIQMRWDARGLVSVTIDGDLGDIETVRVDAR